MIVEIMIDARGLTVAKLHEILKPFRNRRDGLAKAKKEVLLKKAQELGLVGDKTPDPVEPPCASNQRWIPLRDKSETVVAWSLVDDEDHGMLMKFSWHLFEINNKKYAVNNQGHFLHSILMQQSETAADVIDHIDSDGLNNTRNNLRFASRSLNSQNKIKKKGTSSKFIGVSNSKWGWAARHGKEALGYFDSEEKAAYAYDIFIMDKYQGQGKINHVRKPQDFVPYQKRQLTCQSRGVKFEYGKYYASYWDKSTQKFVNLKTFQSEKEASDAYEAYRAEVEKLAEIEWSKRPIERNEDGIAIIPVTVKGVKNAAQTLVDDSNWHWLMKRQWHLDNNGYVCALRCRMHTEVLKVPKGKVVDHRISKLDNRAGSLSENTYGGNGHNRSGYSITGYKGVYPKRKRFRAELVYQGKVKRFGVYSEAIIAAYAFDCGAKQLYQRHAKINDVPSPGDWLWDSQEMKLKKCPV